MMTRLSRREFLTSIGIGASALTLPGFTSSIGPRAKKLNFVFILVDDLGWKDLVCYGSSFYETPNLDRLASQGMRFTDAYAACPVCSPTRASIMAGKYPARMHTTDYFGGRRRGKLNPAPYIQRLPLEETTVAEAFKEAGYTTFFAGKWHLGSDEFCPENQGFDINKGGWRAGHPRSYFSPYSNPKLEDGPKGEHLADRLTAESLKFLDAHKEQPFLLYLSFYSVHTPLQAKEDLKAKYKAKAERLPPHEGPRFIPEGKREARQVQDHPVYGGMMQTMDDNVGRLMKKLENLGIDDHTAVIFMSDNGGLSTSEGSPTSNVPLRAGKGWLYEGGIREPMIIKWPGTVKPGSVCNEPVISTDFFPTMLEMAGLPAKPTQHCDGMSMIPLLKGGKKIARDAIYWHYPHYGNQGGSPGGAVRAGDFKLIEFYEDRRVELYNLKKDIGEKNDLAARMPEKVAELRKILHGWRKEVDALMPSPNPDYKGK